MAPPAQAGGPTAQPPSAIQEISTSGASLPSGPSPSADEQPALRPGDAGYVDLFADGPRPDVERPGEVPGPAAPPAQLAEPTGVTPHTPAPPDAAVTPRVSKVPAIPRPPQEKSALPWILIGAGGLVLLGILALVLLGGAAPARPGRADVVAPPPPAAVPAPAPDAAPPVPAPDTVPPSPPEATPAPREPAETPPEKASADAPDAAVPRSADDGRRARAERRAREREETREREAAARAREERAVRQRERQRREAEKVAAADAAEVRPDQASIDKVVASTGKAFDDCIVAAARSREVKLDGRRVLLRLNIQASGAVTYPTLDDVTLNGTGLGSCLKSAARLMVFPRFKGDAMHVEVPLVLSAR